MAGLESLVFGTGNGKEIGTLLYAATGLSPVISNIDVVVIILGELSAVIDNVPLVAASMAMYDFPLDHRIWHFRAYIAGTGGSLLVIRSAAGVAAMGMEKINFMWYLKNIAPLALFGYLGGALNFIVLSSFF